MIFLRYASVKFPDIANGPGIRVSLFVSGCRMRCPGCFNEEAQSFDYGQEYTEETHDYILKLLDNPHVSGLSILGGEPFETENIEDVMRLCMDVKEAYSEKDIWLWTGREWEDIAWHPTVKYIDVLVDGPFVQAQKDLSLYFRGSSNQRVINVKKSLKVDAAVRLAGDWK